MNLYSLDATPTVADEVSAVVDDAQVIAKTLPVSVTLGLCAVAIAVVCGVTIGTLAAVRRNGPLDWISLNIAMIGISVSGDRMNIALRSRAMLANNAALDVMPYLITS